MTKRFSDEFLEIIEILKHVPVPDPEPEQQEISELTCA